MPSEAKRRAVLAILDKGHTREEVLPVLQAVRAAVADAQFVGAMDKVQTPISYLDAADFRGFLAKDAARLKVAVEKIGKLEEK